MTTVNTTGSENVLVNDKGRITLKMTTKCFWLSFFLQCTKATKTRFFSDHMCRLLRQHCPKNPEFSIFTFGSTLLHIFIKQKI